MEVDSRRHRHAACFDEHVMHSLCWARPSVERRQSSERAQGAGSLSRLSFPATYYRKMLQRSCPANALLIDTCHRLGCRFILTSDRRDVAIRVISGCASRVNMKGREYLGQLDGCVRGTWQNHLSPDDNACRLPPSRARRDWSAFAATI